MLLTHSITTIKCFSNSGIVNSVTNCIEVMCCFPVMLQLINTRVEEKRLYTAIPIGLLFCVILIKSHVTIFVFAILLYFIGEDTQYSHVTELIWKGYLLLIALSFLLYLLGVSDGGMSRSYSATRSAPAFGFSHANTAGRALVLMCLAKMATDIQKNKKIICNTAKGIFNLCFYMVSILLCLFLFKCRTAFLTFCIAACFMLFFRNYKYKNTLTKYLFMMVQPFLFLFTYITAKSYPDKLTLFLDKILTSRFFLNNYHLRNNSVTLFGKTISYETWTLDSSYMGFLLERGIVSCLVYVLASFFLFKKAWRNRDGYIIAIAIALYGFGFMESGILDIFVNFTYLYLLVGDVTKRNTYKDITIEDALRTNTKKINCNI